MPFAIEALQSKAKLQNARRREFQQNVLWPEFAQPETETIIDSATHRMKIVVESTLAKIRGVISTQQRRRPAAVQRDVESANSQGEDEEEDDVRIEISEEANEEVFLESVVVMK